MQDQKSSSAGDTIAGVYAIAFLGASLVAVAGIAVTSVFRALDAWEERKEQKRKVKVHPLRPQPMPNPKPSAKPAKPTAVPKPTATAPSPAPAQ